MQNGIEFNIENYQGEDLILATGAPGSRWSASLQAISFNDDINKSDYNGGREYERPSVQEDGTVIRVGWHRGVYWGPFHEYGQNFDKLNQLSKEQIVKEFLGPFENFKGKKVIKSHWFSYHLDYLHSLFPKAVIVGFYLPDDICFNWWHVVGGWDISYPHYNWYENDICMQKQITEENAKLIKFMVEHGVQLKRFSGLEDVCPHLGLDYNKYDFLKSYHSDSKISSLVSDRTNFKTNNDIIEFTKGMLDRRIKSNMIGIFNPNNNNIPLVEQDLLDLSYSEINRYSK